MKKAFKYIAILVTIIIVGGLTTCAVFNKELPVGTIGPKADVLANNIWKSLNKAAWDNTRFVAWSFNGKHHYVWDKEANLVRVNWKKISVLLDPNKVTGVGYEDGEEVLGVQADKLVQKAWSYWCNDMYWLVAPFKIKDEGVELFVVSHSDGDRLKVSYMSGGVTPGDSYIWILDAKGRPVAYEMYTSIIPVQGLNASWEGWQSLSTGAIVSSEHKIGKLGLKLKDIRGGNALSDIGLETDIWEEIRTESHNGI